MSETMVVQAQTGTGNVRCVLQDGPHFQEPYIVIITKCKIGISLSRNIRKCDALC